MQELEEQALREESKSHHDFLSAYQTALHHSHNPSRRIWLPLITPYWGDHLHHLHLFNLPGHPQQKNNHPQLPHPYQCPNDPPSQKRQLPTPEPQGSMSIDETTSRATQEGPSSPKKHETPDWFTTLKPSHAGGFPLGLQYHKGCQDMLLF